jgi:hypothetical protein
MGGDIAHFRSRFPVSLPSAVQAFSFQNKGLLEVKLAASIQEHTPTCIEDSRKNSFRPNIIEKTRNVAWSDQAKCTKEEREGDIACRYTPRRLAGTFRQADVHHETEAESKARRHNKTAPRSLLIDSQLCTKFKSVKKDQRE